MPIDKYQNLQNTKNQAILSKSIKDFEKGNTISIDLDEFITISEDLGEGKIFVSI